METVDSVKRRLRAKAHYRAADLGFAPGCDQLVDGLVSKAAQKLADEGYLLDPEHVALAEVNIERFIMEMIFEARRLGLNELHESTFYWASKELCPLWPLC